MKLNTLYRGDCLDILKTLPENSVDSIITDPPYELGFMGKSWDSTGIANNVELWKECLRVLKPGGHLLAFSGTRTYHRMASAIEDAGFEVRDMIEWVYGSGFPKSLNIGKAVDKLQGNEREVVGEKLTGGIKRPPKALKSSNEYDETRTNNYTSGQTIIPETKGTSEWEGWGTALKPAHEPICMARKPLAEKTVAENCLKWGTGGINIDESRVEGKLEGDPNRFTKTDGGWGVAEFHEAPVVRNEGRFPANLLHDNSEEVRECFPETAKSKSGGKGKPLMLGEGVKDDTTIQERGGYDDNGGNASRFFKSIIDDKNTCNYKQKQHTMNDLYSNNLLWKNTFVDNAERLLKIIQAIIENTAHLNADELQEEKLSRLVKNAERNADLGEIVIALNIVAIKGKQGELVYQEVLNHFLDYMEDYKKCSQILNLVKLVEISDNTDITEITVNLLKSFGSAQSVTEENTHFENLDTDDLKGDWKSLIYQAKASKSDRGEGNNHATVKPTTLMEYLIKMMTREGQIVLDPFGGSGTTGVACKNTNRNYILIEKDEGYCDIIEKRLSPLKTFIEKSSE